MPPLLNVERRHGKNKPVIKKALVELDDFPFRALKAARDAWALGDYYRSPGPIQFEGPGADDTTISLMLELGGEVALRHFLASAIPDASSSSSPPHKRAKAEEEAAAAAAAGGAAVGARAAGGAPSSRVTPDGVRTKLSDKFVHQPRYLECCNALQRARLAFQPELPPVLRSLGGVRCGASSVVAKRVCGDSTTAAKSHDVGLIREGFRHIFGQPVVRLDSGGGAAKTAAANNTASSANASGARADGSSSSSSSSNSNSGGGGGGGGGVDREVEARALRVGVVFCGRQAPGGHNVLWGLQEALRALHPDGVAVGFEGGTQGLFQQRAVVLTPERLALYRNQVGVA